MLYFTIMEESLKSKTATNLIIIDKGNSHIVIGAPHHAPGGIKHLPCPEHDDSDENTGFLAFKIGELLSAHTIIACLAKVDPNKELTTEYSKQIIKWAPRYLIEIHGHGGKAVKEGIIEISSGSSERNNYSEQFAEDLQKRFSGVDGLKHYMIRGTFNNIHFKASKTATIIDHRWIPFHIELPPSLRINAENGLPESSKQLIEILADTIRAVCV